MEQPSKRLSESEQIKPQAASILLCQSSGSRKPTPAHKMMLAKSRNELLAQKAIATRKRHFCRDLIGRSSRRNRLFSSVEWGFRQANLQHVVPAAVCFQLALCSRKLEASMAKSYSLPQMARQAMAGVRKQDLGVTGLQQDQGQRPQVVRRCQVRRVKVPCKCSTMPWRGVGTRSSCTPQI